MAEDLSKKFYVWNYDEWRANLLKCKKFSNSELEIKVIRNGIILPARNIPNTEKYKGGVCDDEFNFVAGFTRRDPREETMGGGFASVESSYTVAPEEIIQLKEDVIFGGSLIGHFGHFILECWSRLWYVIQHPELQLKILFITTTHGGYHKWFDDFFQLMGIAQNRIIYVDKPVQCHSVIVPEQSQYNAWNFVKYTKEFFIPYQKIKSRIKPAEIKKIYLTRKNVIVGKYRRICFNEEYFENFFSEHGFKVIAPEKLSIEEQISLVMGADEIAATVGTLTHWAIFCKPTVKFIMLTRDSSSASAIQLFINEAFDIKNYYIVEAWKNFLYVQSHVDGIFFLGSNKYWKIFVKNYFNVQIEVDDDYFYVYEALEKYVDLWYQKYGDSKQVMIDSLKGMLNRIVELESQVTYKRSFLSYQTHAHRIGWSDWISENHIGNPLDQKCDIQAIKINFSEPFHNVYYSVYYNEEEGWSEEVSNGEQAGTTGKSKAIFGIKIRLDAEGTKKFDIFYRAHKFDGEWTAWAKNGAELLSDGQKLNAIQIGLKNKT